MLLAFSCWCWLLDLKGNGYGLQGKVMRTRKNIRMYGVKDTYP